MLLISGYRFLDRAPLDAWWRAVSLRTGGVPAQAHATVCEVFKWRCRRVGYGYA
jgi:hypothetical protein